MLSKRQRPKVDDYADEGYLFGVLHFPVYDRTIQRLNAAELDFFVGPDYLVTLPTVELLPVTRLFRRCEEDEAFREQLFSKGSGRLLYEVLDDLFDYCFPILDKIGYKLDALEDDMFDGRSEEVVRDISNVKQEIISYRKIIKPERSTLRLLERHVERFLPEELELYFDDIVDAAERIWDMLDNYKEVVEALETTNEQIVSHRQNEVLRILTIISFIMLPLFVITGIFGMNVHFPGENTTVGFWVIVAGMIGCVVGMVGVLPLQALAVMPKPLWAPWRLEYVRARGRARSLHLLRARGGAARPPRRAGARRHEQVPLLVGASARRAAPAHRRLRRARRRTRRPRFTRSPRAGSRRFAPSTRRTGSTSAGTSAGSPAPASRTTSTSTSSRAGTATRASCPCSPTSKVLPGAPAPHG